MRVSLVLLGVLASATASADRTIPAGLFVSKSENRNEVRYSVQVGEQCEIASPAPVRAYWQMLERGPDAVEPLLAREERAYGIARQQVAGGDTVVVWLRALPSRPITIHVARAGGACVATAEATVAGRTARLERVYVALGFLHVDHLMLEGRSEGRVVRERIDPE